jgi:hypothetical protein
MDRNHMLATAPPSAAPRDPDASQITTPASPQSAAHAQIPVQRVPSISGPFPPSYSQAHDSSVPTSLPATLHTSSHNERDVMLPPLSTVTRGQGLRDVNGFQQKPSSASGWPSLSPLGLPTTAKIDSPSTMDLDTGSNSVNSATSPDRYGDGRAPSVNLDDPDVRLAAEALGDLRAGMYHPDQRLPLTC